MNATSLPQWALDILSAVPKAGEGFHNWLFRASRALWKCGRSESRSRSILENAAANCGRFVPQREIDEQFAIRRSARFNRSLLHITRGLLFNPEQREAVIQETQFGLVDLWEASPVKFR